MSKKIDPITRWNLGELSAQALLEEFSGFLERTAARSGLGLTIAKKQQLAQRLENMRPRPFANKGDFLSIMKKELIALWAEEAEEIPSRPRVRAPDILNPRFVDFLVKQELSRGFESETLDTKDDELRSALEAAQYAEYVSFSSLGFAPLSTVPSQVESYQLPPGQISQIVAKLEKVDPLLARLAVFRFFGGLTLAEIAERSSTPLEVVKNDWERLKREIPAAEAGGSSPLVLLDFDAALLKTLQGHPELLKTLDWRSFERILAAILERLGFEIELQRGTKDGGIDIFALRRDPAFGGHRYIIQAKRWSGRVGIAPVRELLFLQNDLGISKACLATTARFTRGAWDLANEHRWQLELRDLEGIHNWVKLALRNSG